MNKKRTLQNNLSYALKYMFGNYGINIFLDSKKFIVTLNNLIPNLEEEINLVKFAMQKNAISIIVNSYNQRDIDKNFAYLRAKTILTKNGISEKAALYILDCFLYAFDWIDDFPDYEDLCDEDFIIPKITEEYTNDLAKEINIKPKEKSNIKLDKKNISDKSNTSSDSSVKKSSLQKEDDTLYSKKENTENTIAKKEYKSNNTNEKTNTNSKYYLSHDFDDDEDDYYDYGSNNTSNNNFENEYDLDDEDEEYYESNSLFKKIALILIPIIILCGLGFFLFKNFTKEAEPFLSGVSITTQYKVENGNYVLPISQETYLNVIIQSKNSKKIDISKLRYKLENGSICNFQSNGKKCTITGLKEGSAKLIVIYNNEIVDSINLYFKDFVAEEQKIIKENAEKYNNSQDDNYDIKDTKNDNNAVDNNNYNNYDKNDNNNNDNNDNSNNNNNNDSNDNNNDDNNDNDNSNDNDNDFNDNNNDNNNDDSNDNDNNNDNDFSDDNNDDNENNDDETISNN